MSLWRAAAPGGAAAHYAFRRASCTWGATYRRSPCGDWPPREWQASPIAAIAPVGAVAAQRPGPLRGSPEVSPGPPSRGSHPAFGLQYKQDLLVLHTVRCAGGPSTRAPCIAGSRAARLRWRGHVGWIGTTEDGHLMGWTRRAWRAQEDPHPWNEDAAPTAATVAAGPTGAVLRRPCA
jgi:hypothetical protein